MPWDYENQEEELLEQQECPPFDGGVSTGPKVARWIEKVTAGQLVWNQRGWDYLKKLKQSWQRPRPHHGKGDKQEPEALKKTTSVEGQVGEGQSRCRGGNLGI